MRMLQEGWNKCVTANLMHMVCKAQTWVTCPSANSSAIARCTAAQVGGHQSKGGRKWKGGKGTGEKAEKGEKGKGSEGEVLNHTHTRKLYRKRCHVGMCVQSVHVQSEGGLKERSIRQLSGGERRRVALALALGFADLVSGRGQLRCNLIVLDEVLQAVAVRSKNIACTADACSVSTLHQRL